jgi:transcriptional regulator with XRE-family HTH domain
MMNSKSPKPRRRKSESPFKDNLRAILDERGISQRGAAEIMGVSVTVVHDWLQGSYPNDPNAVLKFCKAIGCDFQWMLTGEDSSPHQIQSNLSQFFDIEDDPMFSGIFKIEAKRLKKK